MRFNTIDELVGDTPLIRFQRQDTGSNLLLGKLEGNNPAGSVKDRPALSMIVEAEKRSSIKPGDSLIEATSGNTGIALAMVAAIRGYNLTLVMPKNASLERRAVMAAFGAKLILTPKRTGMEGAIDAARELEARGKGTILNQFANPDNPLSHYKGTGPEIWKDTDGKVTHFVSSMGTTGTIMGTSRFLKEKNPDVQIVGVQPDENSRIPGIRKWPKEYLPDIYEEERVDKILYVSRREAEESARSLAREEGLFCGISSGGCVAAALKLCKTIEDGVVVCIICDRGDRYISTGIYSR